MDSVEVKAVRRYDKVQRGDFFHPELETMEEDLTGEWVKYEDHVATLEQLTKERDEQRERADREMRTRIEQGADFLQQLRAATKDQIEIRELLGCTEDDDDYIGALRRVGTERDAAFAGGEELSAALRTANAEVARLRKVTGSECPVCGRFLKAEHCVNIDNEAPCSFRGTVPLAYFRTRWTADEEITRRPCITVADLIANHPAIAREMGVSE